MISPLVLLFVSSLVIRVLPTFQSSTRALVCFAFPVIRIHALFDANRLVAAFPILPQP